MTDTWARLNVSHFFSRDESTYYTSMLIFKIFTLWWQSDFCFILLDYIFLEAYSEICSYVCFLMKIVEIVLILLFILPHLSAKVTIKTEGFYAATLA